MNKRETLYCKHFGEALKLLRQEKTAKSSYMFACENDIPRSTLSRIERGENEAGLVTLKKIAEAFGLSQSEFFAEIEKRMPVNFKIFDDEHY